MQFILHFPKSAYNILYVNKLSKDTNYYVLFGSSTCVYQDQNSGKTIENFREMNELYCIEEIKILRYFKFFCKILRYLKGTPRKELMFKNRGNI